MDILQLMGSLELGMIYAWVAIGVYLTFRIVDFADLTVDGSFPLGAAVTASLIVLGWNPILATLIALLAGMVVGCITGYLHVKWNILGLLASILTMTALYSINLRIMGSRPNIALINEPTIFTLGPVLAILGVITLALVLILRRFFLSHFGLAMRAAGVNPKAGAAYGIRAGSMKILALALSNGVVALAGSVFAQSQGFADVGMGTGTIVVGLASVIIGEALFHPKSIAVALVACTVGSVLYRIVIAFALNAHDFGLKSSDLNLITSVLVGGTMMAMKLRKRGGERVC